MPRARVATGIEIEYETFGNPKHPALLLIMGLGGTLAVWRRSFCQKLVDIGYYVIRFDNRDIGLSTHLDDEAPAPVHNFMLKAVCNVVCDMAMDAIGLLDAIGINKAVIFGGSMGGMISQFILLNHTDRVAGMILCFTSGTFPLPHSSIRSRIMQPIPAGLTFEQLLVATNEKQRMLAGPAEFTRGRTEEANFEAHKEIYSESLKRHDYYADGGGKSRQTEVLFEVYSLHRLYKAIVCSKSRFTALKRLYSNKSKGGSINTKRALLSKALELPQIIIIHGRDDLMVMPAEGRKLHRAIPGSKYVELPDMGHEIHPVHFNDVLEQVRALQCHHGAPNSPAPATAPSHNSVSAATTAEMKRE